MGYTVIERFILRSDIILGEQTVPLFDMEAFAGFIPSFVDEHPAIDEIKVSEIPKCEGSMHVKGDSMYPLLMDGDIVMYKIVPNRRGGLFFGQMYLLAFDRDGEECMAIKYVYESDTPGFYRLVSKNPDYPPVDIPVSSVRTMAIVKASLRLNI